MYFRTKKTRTGQALQLVESYRNAEGQPRQRIVVSLGDAEVSPADRLEIARLVEDTLYDRRQIKLFPIESKPELVAFADEVVKRIEREGRWMPAKPGQGADKKSEIVLEKDDTDVIDGVLVEQVTHLNTTSLGPVLACLHVWNELGMPELLKQFGFAELQCKTAAALVVNRLDSPVCEHAMPEWLNTCSLPDLLGDDLRRKADDTFYRVGDRLLENRDRIEQHLRRRQAEHFSLERGILLYDLTNTHFEGVCAANPKAVRGRNKQKRHDCPQVVVGMVFDEFGFELAHRVFKGNMADSPSLPEMIEILRKCCPGKDLGSSSPPMIVMDSGIGTAENLRLLRENGFHYLVCNSRPKRKEYADDFAAADFRTVPYRDDLPPVEVRLRQNISEIKHKNGTTETVRENLLFCRSDKRCKKETAIRSRAEERLLEQLEKLRERVSSGKLKNPEKIQRAIGGIQRKNPRVSRFFDITFADGFVRWQRQDATWERDSSLMGSYILKTNRLDLEDERIWRLYITLTRAEDGFRSLKSHLGLRPNHHQIEERVDAHIFITVLAYQILSFILHSLRQSGDHRSWPTLRRILQTHSYTTIILPTKNGDTHRLRKPGTPEREQKQIYDRLGVCTTKLPKTLITTSTQKTATL